MKSSSKSMREEIIKDGWTDVIGEHDSENGAPVPKGTGKLPGLTSFEENRNEAKAIQEKRKIQSKTKAPVVSRAPGGIKQVRSISPPKKNIEHVAEAEVGPVETGNKSKVEGSEESDEEDSGNQVLGMVRRVGNQMWQVRTPDGIILKQTFPSSESAHMALAALDEMLKEGNKKKRKNRNNREKKKENCLNSLPRMPEAWYYREKDPNRNRHRRRRSRSRSRRRSRRHGLVSRSPPPPLRKRRKRYRSRSFSGKRDNRKRRRLSRRQKESEYDRGRGSGKSFLKKEERSFTLRTKEKVVEIKNIETSKSEKTKLYGPGSHILFSFYL